MWLKGLAKGLYAATEGDSSHLTTRVLLGHQVAQKLRAKLDTQDSGNGNLGNEILLGLRWDCLGPCWANDGSQLWERGSDGLTLGSTPCLTQGARPAETKGRGGANPLQRRQRTGGRTGSRCPSWTLSPSPGRGEFSSGASACGLNGLRRGGRHRRPMRGIPSSPGGWYWLTSRKRGEG